jgi:thioredoxin reductase (NADPH)
LRCKVLIIGAGPAGIAAAIQLKRYGIDLCLIEKDSIGGLLINANLIENYPGFPKGITGPGIVSLLEAQLQNFDIQTIKDDILSLEYDGCIFSAKGTQLFEGEYLVLATGTQPKKLEIAHSYDIHNKYLFYEARGLRDITGKRIAIIGSGDAAFDYALTLSVKNNVEIFVRGKASKAIQPLINKVQGNANIAVRINHQLKGIEIVYEQIVLEFGTERGSIREDFDLMLVAIGREPTLPEVNFDINEQAEKRMFIIGDIKNELYRQATIAVGDGIRAAMTIYNTIMENK